MDAFARGLKIAAAIRRTGRLAEFVRERYSSWDSGIGKEIGSGKSSFAALEKYMLKKGEPSPNTSGRQEFLENLINEFIFRSGAPHSAAKKTSDVTPEAKGRFSGLNRPDAEVFSQAHPCKD